MKKMKNVKTFRFFNAMLLLALALSLFPNLADAARTGPETEASKVAIASKLETIFNELTVGSVPINAATEVQKKYPNALLLLSQKLTATVTPGVASYYTFEIPFEIVEGSPLIGQKTAEALFLVGAKDPANNAADVESFSFNNITFNSSLTEFVDEDTGSVFKQGKGSIQLKVNNLGNDGTVAGSAPNIDQSGSGPQASDTTVEINLFVYAWAGAPDALSPMQIDGATGLNYHSIDADAPAIDKENDTYKLDPAEAGKEVNFVQKITINKALDNAATPAALNNDEAVILKIRYDVGVLEEMKDFSTVRLQSLDDAGVATDFGTQVTSKTPKELVAGEWLAFLPSADITKAENAIPVGANLEELEYDIYYHIPVPSLPTTSTVRIIAPVPLPKNAYNIYAARLHQADGTDYPLVYKNTDKGESSATVGTLDYGFVTNTLSAEGEEANSREGISLSTDLSSLASPSYVTYVVPFTVPHYTGSPWVPIKSTVNNIEVRNLISGGPKFEKVYFAPYEATKAWQCWVVAGEGVKSTTEGKVLTEGLALDEGATYFVHYTVAVNSEKKAISNVAVITKTGRYLNSLGLNAAVEAAPTFSYPQAGTTSGLISVYDGTPTQALLDTSIFAEQPATGSGIVYAADDAGNASFAQKFAYTGFDPAGGDAFIFSRAFTFELSENPDGTSQAAPLISENTLRLQKWDDSGFKANFTAADLENGEITIADKQDVLDLDGKFWVLRTYGGTTREVDVKAGTEPYQPGAVYTVFFVIKDGGTFDTEETRGIIADPNVLYAQAPASSHGGGGSGSSSGGGGGCSVGGSEAYDLVLLLLASLGLLLLRVRARKS